MRLRSVVLAATLSFLASPALAQTYPSKPIRILVPFAAGGAVDTLARLIGNKLGEQLGQPVLVENRAGAGGNLAPDALAKLVPVSQIVYGTDFPYRTAADHSRGVSAIFKGDELKAVDRDNALRLLPRLKTA